MNYIAENLLSYPFSYANDIREILKRLETIESRLFVLECATKTPKPKEDVPNPPTDAELLERIKK